MATGVLKISNQLWCGPSPKKELLTVLCEEFGVTHMVNLRTKTGYMTKRRRDDPDEVVPIDTSRWYENYLKKEGADVVYIREPMDSREEVEDTSIISLAKRIFKAWQMDKTDTCIYIHNRDGLGNEIMVAFATFALMSNKKGFDCPKWLKENGHYEACRSREDKEQLQRVYDEAVGLAKWKHWSFKPKKKKQKVGE